MKCIRDELIFKLNLRGLSMLEDSIDTFLGMAKGLFTFAQENQFVRDNPADDISVTEGKKQRPHALQGSRLSEEVLLKHKKSRVQRPCL